MTCCSGCFSAYRRAAIMPHLEWWEHQTFLGRPSTFGDDRSLTNCVLRDWKVRYESRGGLAHDRAGDASAQFLKQQVRWKRSWTRESLIVARFIWRKHPIAALSIYVGHRAAAGRADRRRAGRSSGSRSWTAPARRSCTWSASTRWRSIYGLYYAMRQNRLRTRSGCSGSLFVFFYLCFLVWQTYYAILTSNRTSWGTRPSEHVKVAEELPA